MSDPAAALRERFGDRLQVNARLAQFTTFKLGGPADWLLTLDGSNGAQQALGIARAAHIPVSVLGGGSNVLIADAGVRGLVIRMHGGEVRRLDAVHIRADAGVTINGLVRWTISHGLAGLEAWAGTPGTVGGAVFGNAHFQGRNIGDLVAQVTLLNGDGELCDVAADDMEFAYDYSRLHRSGEVVVAVDFLVSEGEPERLRAIARDSLAYRKRTQPLATPSAGCIFQNPVPGRDSVPAGIPCSAGALVDRAGLKGAREGQARISPTHANFILNEGEASATDVRTLIERCKREVWRQFAVRLREEIVYLGFDPPRVAANGTPGHPAGAED